MQRVELFSYNHLELISKYNTEHFYTLQYVTLFDDGLQDK
jgi:hypothetical protein